MSAMKAMIIVRTVIGSHIKMEKTEKCEACGKDHNWQKCPEVKRSYEAWECDNLRSHILACAKCQNYFEPLGLVMHKVEENKNIKT